LLLVAEVEVDLMVIYQVVVEQVVTEHLFQAEQN
jgi:hypothetical protein